MLKRIGRNSNVKKDKARNGWGLNSSVRKDRAEIPILERIGAVIQGQNSNVYKNRASTLMFERKRL